MNNQPANSPFPRQLKLLLIACIVLPIARIFLFPNASGGALFWVALFGALSLSIWVGKAGAAKALGYILYFLGAVAPVTLLLGFPDWPYALFLLLQAAIHLVAARRLLKSEELRLFLAAAAKS